MEFKDVQKIIYKKFKDDEYRYVFRTWESFIKSKDLGIRYINKFPWVDSYFEDYEVVDQKKWLFARIKYGIFH